MSKTAGVKRVLFSILIEFFFAVLPLVVLGSVWPSSEHEHPHSFWQGPEWSMTSCILYGLTLARLLQGMMVSAKRTSGNVHTIAVGAVALAMVPLVTLKFWLVA